MEGGWPREQGPGHHRRVSRLPAMRVRLFPASGEMERSTRGPSRSSRGDDRALEDLIHQQQEYAISRRQAGAERRTVVTEPTDGMGRAEDATAVREGFDGAPLRWDSPSSLVRAAVGR